jgi:hypothetical protein
MSNDFLWGRGKGYAPHVERVPVGEEKYLPASAEAPASPTTVSQPMGAQRTDHSRLPALTKGPRVCSVGMKNSVRLVD